MHACNRWCPILTALLVLTACGDASDASPAGDESPEAAAEELAAEQRRAQVLSGLNTFVGLQQQHYREHGTYNADLDALGYEGDPAVQIEVHEADESGWSVVATHDALEDWSCAAFTGDVESVPTTTGGITPETGRVECDPLPGTGETGESGGGQSRV